MLKYIVNVSYFYLIFKFSERVGYITILYNTQYMKKTHLFVHFIVWWRVYYISPYLYFVSSSCNRFTLSPSERLRADENDYQSTRGLFHKGSPDKDKEHEFTRNSCKMVFSSLKFGTFLFLKFLIFKKNNKNNEASKLILDTGNKERVAKEPGYYITSSCSPNIYTCRVCASVCLSVRPSLDAMVSGL